MEWIPVTERLPEDRKWACVQTQDGSVFPAVYDSEKKRWSPVFRGGEMDSLMHGKVLYWQPAPTGFPYLKCDRGHCYLKVPGTTVCPICKHFGFVQEQEEPPVKEEKQEEAPAVEEQPVAEEVPETVPVAQEAEPAEIAATETTPKSTKRSRKKSAKE